MADKRIYQLDTGIDVTGKFFAMDKSGEVEANKYLVTNLISAVQTTDVTADTNWQTGYKVQFGDNNEMKVYVGTKGGVIEHNWIYMDGNVTCASDVYLGSVTAGSDWQGTAYVKTQEPNDNSNKIASTAYVDFIGQTFTDQKVNGFVDGENEVTCTFTNGTLTLEISPSGSEFEYYSNGMPYTKSAAESLAITDTEGLWYYYYNGETLTVTQTWSDDIIREYAIVAIIYWDATNNKQIYFGREFRHGVSMSGATHEYLHETRGFSLESGGLLGDILADENGNLDSHAQFSNEQTVAWDEDAMFTNLARTSTSNIPVYYRDGANVDGIFRIDETASFPVLVTTTRADWNELTGGNWQRTEVTNGDFVLAHVFTTNDTDRPFGVFMGQADYITRASARDGAETEVNNLILNGLPVAEFKFLGTIILQTRTTYSNTVKSRIVSTTDGGDYIDLRGTIIGRIATSTTVTDHNSLAGLQGSSTTNEYFHFNEANYNDLADLALTLTTKGDTLYYDSGYQRRPKGTEGQVFTMASDVPIWKDSSQGVSGSGTVDYLARWTPDGDTLGVGISQDDGTTMGVNIAPSSTRMFNLRNTTVSESVYVTNTYATGNTYGIRTHLSGASTAGYGVYATVVSATTTWGGFFQASGTGGNSFGISANATGAATTNQGLYGTASNATSNNMAVRGAASTTSAAKNYGAYLVTSNSTTNNYGVYATASGGGTTNYGAYLAASGATTNWGLFVNAGDCNVEGGDYYHSSVQGVSGTFEDNSGNTVTVSGGIITDLGV